MAKLYYTMLYFILYTLYCIKNQIYQDFFENLLVYKIYLYKFHPAERVVPSTVSQHFANWVASNKHIVLRVSYNSKLAKRTLTLFTLSLLGALSITRDRLMIKTPNLVWR